MLSRPDRKTFIHFGETADHSIDYLIGILADARTTTLQRVYDVSPEELHWQYAEGWNTIGALLSHIISCEHYFRIEIVEDKRLTKKESALYMPGLEMGTYIPELITGKPIQDYIDRMAESREQLLAKLRLLSKEDFHKKRKGYHAETGHNLAWTIYHLAEDEVHHRGQISLLRKLYKVSSGSS